MSLTSSAASPTAASSALLALTTPFVQKAECTSIWDLTSLSTSTGGTPTVITVLASNSADARFASCQPSGWDKVAPASRFSFSPAVCPDAWTYYSMAATISAVHNDADTSTYSTAYCCASGYTLQTRASNLPATTACVRSVSDRATSLVGTLSQGSGPTAVFTGGLQVHEAWHIAWAASDTAKMSPSLPALTSGVVLATWKAGETIPPNGSSNTTSQDELKGLSQVVLFLEIGIPLIFVALVSCCAWCCIARRRSKRRERLRIQAAVNGGASGNPAQPNGIA